MEEVLPINSIVKLFIAVNESNLGAAALFASRRQSYSTAKSTSSQVKSSRLVFINTRIQIK